MSNFTGNSITFIDINDLPESLTELNLSDSFVGGFSWVIVVRIWDMY